MLESKYRLRYEDLDITGEDYLGLEGKICFDNKFLCGFKSNITQN